MTCGLTVTVTYATDASPLRLDTLQVLVNGVDWTGRFSIGPDSASYDVSEADTLVAGNLTISASISDEVAGRASADRTYEVFPTFLKLEPNLGVEGEEITVTGLGLDPTATNNVLVFSAILQPGTVEAPFSSIEPSRETGRVAVPRGTITGPSFLKVNGKRSRESLTFTVPRTIPACGDVRSAQYLVDGSLIVHYFGYLSSVPHDPACPLVAHLSCGTTGISTPKDVAIRFPTTGSAQVIDQRICPPDAGPFQALLAVAVDKPHTKYAVVTSDFSGLVTVRYGTRETIVEGLRLPQGEVRGLAADFDSEGNLYLALGTNFQPFRMQLYSVAKVDLVAGGTATATPVLTDIVEGQDPRLVVGCDGFAYIASNLSPIGRSSRIFRVRLANGELVATSAIRPESIFSLLGTCNTHELWGLSLVGTSPAVSFAFWRIDAPPDPPGGLGEPEIRALFPLSRQVYGLSIAAKGEIEAFPSSLPKVVVNKVEACEIGGGQRSALPLCIDSCPIGASPQSMAASCEAMTILPTTTRWKPQRGDEPITVRFAGPENLDLTSGTLEINGPGGVGAMTVTGPITQTSPAGPFTYSMQWAGPWTHTDPADGQVKRLPAGNYSVIVRATPQGGSQLQSAPYDKVSLVEVKSIRLPQCGSIPGVTCQDGGARIDANSGPGSGRAAFPDAIQPGGHYRRTVLMKAELEPNLGQDANQITVHFRSIDVDDPSASAAGSPVDDDSVATTSTDNRNENSLIVPSVTASPDQGGAAISFFRVSTQQGNNYRLAASTHESWLAGISGVVSSQTGAVTHSSGETLTEGVQLSEMLTVWRMLHLELDRMDAASFPVTQTDLQVNGSYTKLGKSKLTDQNIDFLHILTFDGSGTGVFDHNNKNDWKGADLNPNASTATAFRVKKNGDHVLSIESGNMATVPVDPAKAYALRDDNLDNLTSAPVDHTLLASILERVYIKLEPWSPNLTALNGFVRNLSNAAQNLMTPAVANSPEYWNVALLAAFEFTRSDDNDPTLEDSTSGNCSQTTDPVAAVFFELIRDFQDTRTDCLRSTVSLAEYQRGTVAHETLHALTLGHDGDHTGALMCASLKNDRNEPNRGDITLAQKAQLRGITRPRADQPIRSSCPTRTCK